MKKQVESREQGHKSKSATGGEKLGSDAKPRGKGRGKSKPNAGSGYGATQKARERAAGYVASPNFAFIAGDALRAQIVAVALHRPYSPSEFAREAGVKLNVASYAFKTLRDKGIIELVKKFTVRGSTVKHMYRATEAALVSDADWGQLAKALRPLFTGTILQDFSARATRAIETGHLFSRDDFCLYWAPRDLDEIAWREQAEINRWYIEASENLEVETVERRAKGESEGSIHATVAVATFPSPTHSEFKKHEAKRKGKRKASKGKAKGKAVSKGKAKATTAKGTAKAKGSGRAAKGKGAVKGKGKKS
jgi:hypothetical protein